MTRNATDATSATQPADTATGAQATSAPAVEAEAPVRIAWRADWAAAQEAARAAGKPIMIDFSTDWCYWCRQLERNTYTHPEVIRLSARQISLKLNAEREGRDLARKFRVGSYPTIVYVDAEGNEVGRIVGYLAPMKFVDAAKPIIERFGKR